MKNNIERINEFLKYWRDIAKENPNLSFQTEEMDHAIYNKLIHLGVNKEDRKIDLRNGNSPTNYKNDQQYSYLVNPNSAFNNWLEYYNKNEEIKVLHSPSWPYFCQFISKNQEARNAKEHIKVYIPLDAKHIEQGGKYIFNFLTNNNIPHVSKIGKEIRFDDIVVRLTKKEDADKLLDFIRRNPYIQEGLIKPNPFAFQKDGIALACDGRESYNDTIAKLISLYILEKKDTNTLNKISYEDFYRFIAIKYKTNFITREGKEFIEIFEIQDKEKERNIREIIALALKCQNKDFNYEEYIEHFNICTKNKEKKKQIDSMLEETETQKLLIEYLKTMCEKYGEIRGKKTCEAYFSTGNTSYITRENDLRKRINSSNLREYIIKLANQKNISILELINQVYLNAEKQSKKSQTVGLI